MPKKNMDRKLIAYKQPYEVATVCLLFRITETELVKLVRRLPKKHSRPEVYALLLGAGYVRHPRKNISLSNDKD